jgi:ATP-dependent Clp protease adaptor protein ClpS
MPIFVEDVPMPVSETAIQPIIRQEEDTRLEPRYRILIHNDDVTPYDYVIRILERVFMLSEELAEHVAFTAHSEGLAIVLIRPRHEAEKLIAIAHTAARTDGFPLGFSLEPEE